MRALKDRGRSGRIGATVDGHLPGGRTDASGSANRLQLITDTRQALAAMQQAIDGARGSVCLEIYTFRDDAVGEALAQSLRSAAARGVRVRLIVDWFGSCTTSEAFFDRMRDQGVDVRYFNPLSPWKLRRLFSRRDHRKILVADGALAFTASFNIGSEYVGEGADGGRWHDTAVRMEGPAARQLQALFEETWEWVLAARRGWFARRLRAMTSSRVPFTLTALDAAAPEHWPAQGQLQVLDSGGWASRRSISRIHHALLRRASERITIVNPYFVPGRRLLRELRAACRRGVEVRLLLPAASDLPPVDFASRALFTRLLRWGAEIWLWQGAHLHSKIVVVDGSWTALGSYNMDHLSAYRNLEVVVAVSSRAFAAQVEGTFEEEKALCTRLELESWMRRPLWRKVLEHVAYFFHHWF